MIAVTRARGMELAGAVDSHFLGEDIGKLCDMEDPLEIPIINDLTMVLGSISQVMYPHHHFYNSYLYSCMHFSKNDYDTSKNIIKLDYCSEILQPLNMDWPENFI